MVVVNPEAVWEKQIAKARRNPKGQRELTYPEAAKLALAAYDEAYAKYRKSVLAASRRPVGRPRKVTA